MSRRNVVPNPRIRNVRQETPGIRIATADEGSLRMRQPARNNGYKITKPSTDAEQMWGKKGHRTPRNTYDLPITGSNFHGTTGEFPRMPETENAEPV